jgi:hypothetical protein
MTHTRTLRLGRIRKGASFTALSSLVVYSRPCTDFDFHPQQATLCQGTYAMSAPEMAGLLSRLDQLERQDRLFRLISLLAAAGVGGAFLIAADRPQRQEQVVAKKLQLVDEDGNVRAALWMNATSHQPSISLYGNDGKERAAMRLSEAGPEYVCVDKTGKRIQSRFATNEQGGYVVLWSPEDQTTFEANASGMIAKRLQMSDDKNKVRASIWMHTNSTYPSVSLYSDQGSERAAMRLTDTGPEYVCVDKGGTRIRSRLGENANGGVLDVFDQENKPSFQASHQGASAKLVQLHDEEFKPRATLGMMEINGRLGPVLRLMDKSETPLGLLAAGSRGGILEFRTTDNRMFFQQSR